MEVWTGADGKMANSADKSVGTAKFVRGGASVAWWGCEGKARKSSANLQKIEIIEIVGAAF